MTEKLFLEHTIDAKHVKNIGEQSVSSSAQAIIEIVKNSYDADATLCTVHFYAKTSLEKYLDVYKIVIEDNGIGMTLNDLQDKWMRIGTESKERNTISPMFGRRVSGEKGMGHFASQKLADKLKLVSNSKMYSKREGSKYSDDTLTLEINWQDYESGKLFNEIKNNLDVDTRVIPDKHGISIELTNLKDEWTLDEINKVKLNLGNLLLPKLIRKKSEHSFDVKIRAHGFTIDESELESTLEKYAPWEITCTLRKNTFSYKIFKLNVKTGKRSNARYVSKTAPGEEKIVLSGDVTCGDANFHLFYYPGGVRGGGKEKGYKGIDWLPKTILKKNSIIKQLVEGAGIKIFNDNVRIMPYGEPGNDWLELESRKVKHGGGRLRNELCLGWIVLERSNNTQIESNNTRIEETTSREQIIVNDAFMFLKNKFALTAVEKLEKYFSELDIDIEKHSVHEKPVSKTASEITQLTEFVEKLDIPKDEKNKQKKKLVEINRLVEKIDEEYEEDIENVTSSLDMYRNLSSLGVTALGFHHEITKPIGNIEGFLDRTLQRWNTLDDTDKVVNIQHALEETWTIMDVNQYIKAYGTLFTGAKGVMRAKEEINIKESLEQFAEGFKDIMKTHKIEFEMVPGPTSFRGLYMNKASFESIIINLFSNSIKALGRVDFVNGRRHKKIRIDYKKNMEYLEIRVKDNGVGIEDSNREEIFREFWSFPKHKEDPGTGMGTTIIREILADYEGTITVENTVYEKDELGKGKTTMLIRIPLSELKENK